MARVTKAMQIEEYCENLRAEMGIETVEINYDVWSTLMISDDGLFRFNDEKAVVALYAFSDTVSPESARKLGSRQYKKSMNEYLVGVRFQPYAMKEAAVWNYINGKTVKFPRVYSYCRKAIPIAKNEYFREYDITDDGLIEIEFPDNNYETVYFNFEDAPKTGEMVVPLRVRLKERDDPEQVALKMYDGNGSIEITVGGHEYELRIITKQEYKPHLEVRGRRSGSDEDGTYLDLLVEVDFFR